MRLRISLLKSLNLLDMESPAAGIHPPETGRLTHEVQAKVASQAERVADRLLERKPILDSLARAAPDAVELAGLIAEDRALAAQLLQAVNSPSYGLRRPVDSMVEAVRTLGLLDVRNITWRTCVNEVLEASRPSVGEVMSDLWSHAFTISRVAYALAHALRVPRAAEISRAALLHDVARLIGLIVWPDWTQTFYAPLRFSNRERLSQERERMGADHARIGADVARSWGLPQELCNTIEQHHAPIYHGPGRVIGNRPAIAVVHVADLLGHIAQPYLDGREASVAHLPVPGWMGVLGVRDNLEAICRVEVVRALLPPTIDRRPDFPLAA